MSNAMKLGELQLLGTVNVTRMEITDLKHDGVQELR